MYCLIFPHRTVKTEVLYEGREMKDIEISNSSKKNNSEYFIGGSKRRDEHESGIGGTKEQMVQPSLYQNFVSSVV